VNGHLSNALGRKLVSKMECDIKASMVHAALWPSLGAARAFLARGGVANVTHSTNALNPDVVPVDKHPRPDGPNNFETVP